MAWQGSADVCVWEVGDFLSSMITSSIPTGWKAWLLHIKVPAGGQGHFDLSVYVRPAIHCISFQAFVNHVFWKPESSSETLSFGESKDAPRSAEEAKQRRSRYGVFKYADDLWRNDLAGSVMHSSWLNPFCRVCWCLSWFYSHWFSMCHVQIFGKWFLS